MAKNSKVVKVGTSLWDLNNGVTITKELHDLFHKKYGKRNFTIDDFLYFKQNYIEK